MNELLQEVWPGLASSSTPSTSPTSGCPTPDHPARWGALFRWAHRAGMIRPVGYRPSRRPTRHGGVVRVWVGTPTQGKVNAA